MNGKDRDWFEAQFSKVYERLDKHSDRLARMEERWSMAEKFVGIFSATIALITTVVVKIIWR